MGVEYISAEQRPVSVRTGGLSVAGERCFAFFYTRKLNPKILRCPMSDLPLSPLLDIESNLSPLPDRLRLLAAAGLTEPAFYRNLNFPKVERPRRSLC